MVNDASDDGCYCSDAELSAMLPKPDSSQDMARQLDQWKADRRGGEKCAGKGKGKGKGNARQFGGYEATPEASKDPWVASVADPWSQDIVQADRRVGKKGAGKGKEPYSGPRAGRAGDWNGGPGGRSGGGPIGAPGLSLRPEAEEFQPQAQAAHSLRPQAKEFQPQAQAAQARGLRPQAEEFQPQAQAAQAAQATQAAQAQPAADAATSPPAGASPARTRDEVKAAVFGGLLALDGGSTGRCYYMMHS